MEKKNLLSKNNITIDSTINSIIKDQIDPNWLNWDLTLGFLIWDYFRIFFFDLEENSSFHPFFPLDPGLN